MGIVRPMQPALNARLLAISEKYRLFKRRHAENGFFIFTFKKRKWSFSWNSLPLSIIGPCCLCNSYNKGRFLGLFWHLNLGCCSILKNVINILYWIIPLWTLLFSYCPPSSTSYEKHTCSMLNTVQSVKKITFPTVSQFFDPLDMISQGHMQPVPL